MKGSRSELFLRVHDPWPQQACVLIRLWWIQADRGDVQRQNAAMTVA